MRENTSDLYYLPRSHLLSQYYDVTTSHRIFLGSTSHEFNKGYMVYTQLKIIPTAAGKKSKNLMAINLTEGLQKKYYGEATNFAQVSHIWSLKAVWCNHYL